MVIREENLLSQEIVYDPPGDVVVLEILEIFVSTVSILRTHSSGTVEELQSCQELDGRTGNTKRQRGRMEK